MSGANLSFPIDPIAADILERLAGYPEASQIVLGGYFALQFYIRYRDTHAIDAWWKDTPDPRTEAVLREVVTQVAAARNLSVRERRFGETLSLELLADGRKCFAVQIAVRSVTLDPPVPSPWPPILLETLSDNIGSKMNALVERGAPRDFTDIHWAVNAGLMNASECWGIWARKNPGAPVAEAKRKAALHLAKIECWRPLESIADDSARENAGRNRDWFRQEFFA